MREHIDLDFYQKNIDDSYCSRVLSAIPFVDNNLPMEERKRYLLHLENCSICLQYIKSLRKDFTAIEKLIPPVSQQSPGDDYQQRVKSLVGGGAGQLKRDWWAHGRRWIEELYHSLRERWKRE